MSIIFSYPRSFRLSPVVRFKVFFFNFLFNNKIDKMISCVSSSIIFPFLFLNVFLRCRCHAHSIANSIHILFMLHIEQETDKVFKSLAFKNFFISRSSAIPSMSEKRPRVGVHWFVMLHSSLRRGCKRGSKIHIKMHLKKSHNKS